jgi:hypothetical protein
MKHGGIWIQYLFCKDVGVRMTASDHFITGNNALNESQTKSTIL